ncbi:restriction endonuclease subunit S [Microbispora sp. NEAU-D428]|uniref:restriction endonuclease subunit S n=1 Tax=Microbispora sitophila TaxID=2771537 RepID=UPI001865C2AA|nr:restriction endonuclease subunit S [Microbispora sitophila]MBE3012531.1 restriction endonuclease subunit S [Microbispora sitophila]
MSRNAGRSWTQTAIKRVAKVRYGLGQPPRLSSEGVPILRATNIYRGKIVPEGLIYTEVKELPLDRAPLLRSGEILVVRSGAYTGDSALVTAEWEGAAPGYDLRLTPERVEPRFLAYSLLGAAVMYQIDIARSRAAQPHLNAEELGEAHIFLPTMDEQRRIADFLDEETGRIRQLESLREVQQKRLEEHTAAIVTETLLPDSLRKPKGTLPWPWLPALAADRPLVRLGYICQLQTGLTVDGKRELSGDVVTRPYLRVANVQATHLALNSVIEITVPRCIAARSTLKHGDVLMTEGGDLDKLGRGTVWHDELPGCLHQNHVFALRPNRDKLDADYLALMTRSVHGRCYFESTGVKTTNLASTNSSKILGFPIPLPSVKQQRELVKEINQNLEVIDQTSSAINRQVALLAERREALITAAVTGQIDVTTARGVGV